MSAVKVILGNFGVTCRAVHAAGWLTRAVAARVDSSGPVMVIEDSAHTYDNTLAVCRTYAPLVTTGSYLIVEDTICHHGIDVGPNPGPYEAAETFRREHPEFIMRRDLEAFVLTWNPTGFLQRRP